MGEASFARCAGAMLPVVAAALFGCSGATAAAAPHRGADGGASTLAGPDGGAPTLAASDGGDQGPEGGHPGSPNEGGAGLSWIRGAPLSHASAIATDGANVYWVPGDGTVHGTPADGGTSTILSADPCRISDAIALDDANVYWSAGYVSLTCTGHLDRAPKTGGAGTTLGSGFAFPGFGGIVLDDRFAYVIGGDTVSDASVPGQSQVWALPKTGGTPRSITDGSASLAPAVDGAYVYWVSSSSTPAPTGSVSPSTIMRTPRDGGPSVPLATTSRNVTALFYFDDRIYWVESGYHGVEYFCVDCSMPAEVDSMGAGDTAPVRAVTMPAGTLIIDAVADDNALWLLQEGTRSGQGTDYPPNDDHTGALWKVAPGAPPTMILGGLPFHTTLAIDDTRVYALGDAAPVSTTK